MSDTTGWVTLERVFDAPIDAVWRMWVDPDAFRSWYGPGGFTVPVAEMDVTEGGTRKICMERVTPNRTMTMWFTGVYREVSAPHRLRYTEAMCDADGTLIPPSAMGMPEGTPDITEVIVELAEEAGRTRMTMIHVGVPDGSPGEGGWSQAFEKLAAALG